MKPWLKPLLIVMLGNRIRNQGSGYGAAIFLDSAPPSTVMLTGLINPWLINRGCPLLLGIQTTFGGTTPLIMGRLFFHPGSTVSPMSSAYGPKPAGRVKISDLP